MHFKQIFYEATRVPPDSRILIDLVITKSPQNIRNSGAVNFSLSDHDLIYAVRKINWKKLPAPIKLLRNYSTFDPSLFCTELSDANFRAGTSCVDTNELTVSDLWNAFKSTFVLIADRDAQVKQK